jgi:hypothetical protein
VIHYALWEALAPTTTISTFFISTPTHHPCANPQFLARPWHVIACADPNDQRKFTVPRHILCISPILKGYIEEPDTTPAGVQRNGAGTLSLNNEGEVVKAMLDYLKQAHGDERTLQSSDRDVAFFVRLYKLALSLGYDTFLATQCSLWKLMSQA